MSVKLYEENIWRVKQRCFDSDSVARRGLPHQNGSQVCLDRDNHGYVSKIPVGFVV